MNPFEQTPSSGERNDNRNAYKAMRRLGYSGLIPFGFGVIIIWLSPWIVDRGLAQTMAKGTLAYAAIIAAFMAGMGTGVHLQQNKSSIFAYLPSMIAALIAWVMVLPNGYFFFSLGSLWRAFFIALIFAWLYTRDQAMVRRNIWPSWYTDLRLRLTAWVIISLSAIIARMLLWGYI